jgi:hypothetical protein
MRAAEAADRHDRAVERQRRMMALTREPSGRRASTIGELVDATADARHDRSMITSKWALSRKITFVGSSLP